MLQTDKVEEAAANHSAGAPLSEAGSASYTASGQQLLWLLLLGGPPCTVQRGAWAGTRCYQRLRLQREATRAAGCSTDGRRHSCGGALVSALGSGLCAVGHKPPTLHSRSVVESDALCRMLFIVARHGTKFRRHGCEPCPKRVERPVSVAVSVGKWPFELKIARVGHYDAFTGALTCLS